MAVEVSVVGPEVARSEEVLTPAALAFVADLQERFGPRREQLLAARAVRPEQIAATGRLDFLDDTAALREGDWSLPAPPADLTDRRVESTGPTGDGFDGSWVAHPDLVSVCREVFDARLDGALNQLSRLRENVIRALMEDAATAEISRSQVWQWIAAGVEIARDDGSHGQVAPRVSSPGSPTRNWPGSWPAPTSTPTAYARPTHSSPMSRWPSTAPTSSPCPRTT